MDLADETKIRSLGPAPPPPPPPPPHKKRKSVCAPVCFHQDNLRVHSSQLKPFEKLIYLATLNPGVMLVPCLVKFKLIAGVKYLQGSDRYVLNRNERKDAVQNVSKRKYEEINHKEKL